jgi:PAS domain S-box-containing protein
MNLKQLKEKIAFLEDVLESIPIGIIILDSEGRIVMMNRWQERISQVDRHQVLGSSFHGTWKRLFDQGVYDAYWELIKNKESYDMILDEVYPQFFDQRITAIARGVPLDSNNGFVLLHEVSEAMKRDKRGLEKLAERLAESMNFLANLIDSSPNIVITTGQDYQIRSANKTGVHLFGYNKEEFVGKHISFLFTDDAELDRYMEIALGETGVEVWCKKENGKAFPAKMKLRDIKDKTGEVQAKLFILADLTKEKEMEDKLVLSERYAIYSELMAGVAHQINNPLVGVTNFSSLLLEKMNPDDPNRELVETIYQAAQECRKMIASMTKSISEPQSTFHNVNLKETLENAIEVVWRDERDAVARIVLKKRFPEGLPKIRGDSLQLLQVFRNILTNAIDAMPDGGVLDIGTLVDPENREIRLRFSDTGTGIPEENLTHIFKPFFSTKNKPGKGLGLSFAFQVIKAHDGRIEVASQYGKGSHFTAVLPYESKEKES